MKKLLVLTLVVGIASLAPAAISFTDNSPIEGDAVLTLTVDMPTVQDMGNYMVAVSKSVGTIGAGTTILGDLSDDKTTYYPQYYLYPNMAYAGLDPALVSANFGILGDTSGSMSGLAVTGIQFTHLGGAGTIDLWFSTDGTNYSVVDSISVPEPATMGLLGLGGLLLRRKK